MPFAIIETGGKQYMVSANSKILIEKLLGDAGAEVVFDKVLLHSTDDRQAQIGKPYLAGAKVVGKVLKQARARKIKIFKYKSKIRYRRRRGHRQEYTEVEIVKL